MGYKPFSETETYAKNDIVIYEGALYKFTATHDAGAWIGTDAEPTSIEELIVKFIHIVAESNTTVNGYEVPELTTEQIAQAFNVLADGGLVIITEADEQMHFLVTQADIVDGGKHISFEFYDKMQLQYAEDKTITFTSRVIPDAPTPTVIRLTSLVKDGVYTAGQLAEIGLTDSVLADIVANPYKYVFKRNFGTSLAIVNAYYSPIEHSLLIFAGAVAGESGEPCEYVCLHGQVAESGVLGYKFTTSSPV